MGESILVVGAGATGGYFGARLLQAGRDVTFLLHAKRAQALHERGLKIVATTGTETVSPRSLTAGEISGRYDVILLTVQSAALESAIDDLAAAVGPDTVIIPFLNGMRHLPVLNRRFGQDAVLGGVVKVATELNADGDILLLAPGATLDLGSQTRGATDRSQKIAAELGVDGLTVKTTDDIVAAMWHKWVFITSLTATTVLGGGTIGEVVAASGGGTLGLTILAEAAAVSTAAGYPLSPAENSALQSTVSQPGSPLTTSLYRAVVAGRSTETEPMLGDFIRRAREWEISTPLLDLATLRLRVYENRLRTENS